MAGPLNLKDGDDELIRKTRLILQYGAAIVVNFVDENGEAGTFELKTKIAARVYKKLLNNGCPAFNIVFECKNDNLICSWIQDNCPGAFAAKFPAFMTGSLAAKAI
uniref:Uncharacterized protein n=1 Tax=uncultured bacterium contig00004 TaxID=1181496 RepID=A0A806JXS6_9BACT|nr:hypothetical protein [uncultured bacterium contig00004]